MENDAREKSKLVRLARLIDGLAIENYARLLDSEKGCLENYLVMTDSICPPISLLRFGKIN